MLGHRAVDGRAPSAVRVLVDFGEPASGPVDVQIDRHDHGVSLRFRGEVKTDVARQVSVALGGLDDVRVVPVEAGSNHWAVHARLSEGAAAEVFRLGDQRWVIDVLAAASTAATRGGEPSSPQPGADAPSWIVVLDPGHGGDDYGARYEGLSEAKLVLDISERAAALLRRRLPGSRILLTRETDVFVPLEERVAFANAVRADAFVSVHLNAADEPVETGGVATFVLDTNNERQAKRLAARENGVRTSQVSDLELLFARLHRGQQATQSRDLAEAVHRASLATARTQLPRLPDRGVKEAMFYVLVGARMPAILLEASFLTHPQEAERLRTVRYREALSRGVADGVVRYLVSRGTAPSP